MYDKRFEENFKDILNSMLDEVPDSLDKRDGSLIFYALGPTAVRLSILGANLQYIVNRLIVNNMTGNYLSDYVTSNSPIKRHPATKAIKEIECRDSNKNLMDIEIGERFLKDDIYFKVISRKDKGIFEIESEIVGSESNNVYGDLIPVDFINNLGKVTIINHLIDGYNQENDDNLIQRYLEYKQTPATSGNIYHYKLWAKEVPGVLDVKVHPLWNGKNTVKLSLIDNDKKPASPELVKKVQDYIDPNITGEGRGKAPIGAYCTVTSATTLDIKINVKIKRNHDISMESIKEKIAIGINDYFKLISFKENEISYAKIGASILYSDGVLDVLEYTMNGDIKNILLDTDQIPVLVEVIVNE